MGTRERFIDIPALRRLAPVKSFDEKARTVEVVWSTGSQVRRYDWFNDETWLEELALDGANLKRLNGGAPVLDSHQRFELDNVIGVVERAWIAGGEGRAVIKFSSRAEVASLVQDVKDGVIRNVSIGYEVHKFEERGKDKKSGQRIMVATDWTPHEISFVPVGADAEAGARARGATETETTRCAVVLSAGTPSTVGGSQMTNEVTNDPSAGGQTAETRELQPRQAGAPAGNGYDPQQALRVEKERQQAIRNLAKANQIPENVMDIWVNSGANMEQVSEGILQIMQERGKNGPKTTALGLTSSETRRFSLAKAILAVRDQNWANAGFEAECSRTIAQQLGRIPESTKFFVPYEVQERQLPTPRSMTQYGLTRDATVAGTGGFLVETANVGFIELLRNRSVMFNMGARRLPGLVGNVAIPKLSATGSATWLANEASTITEINQTFAQVPLSPKTVGGYTEISRLLLLQSNPAVEGIVQGDLATVVALAIDSAAINGAGASGVPAGILDNAYTIGNVTGTSLGYAGVLEFQSDVATANALNLSCGYVTTPAVAALMMAEMKVANDFSPCWEGNMLDGTMVGFRAMSSNQMPTATMLFGDFGQLIIAEWGTLEIEVNPYANFQAGIIGVRAIASVDVGVRHELAFSEANTIT